MTERVAAIRNEPVGVARDRLCLPGGGARHVFILLQDGSHTAAVIITFWEFSLPSAIRRARIWLHWSLGTSMWTYLVGPFAAFLPKHWREALPFADEVKWSRAAAISGLVEVILAFVLQVEWYSHAMSTWVDNGVGLALSGKLGPVVRLQDIGGVALVIWATHPFTWLLCYTGLEGTVRLCAAAFAGNSCGSLPLFLFDKIIFSRFRPRPKGVEAAGPGVRHNVSTYVGAVQEHVHGIALREVPDELCFTKDESGEMLDVRAWRRKQDWTPPRIVRYGDAYYRLEADSRAGGPRPFLYRLRRLSAGVPGRNVLIYAPMDAVIRAATPVGKS
jgi:hypothetical protein